MSFSLDRQTILRIFLEPFDAPPFSDNPTPLVCKVKIVSLPIDATVPVERAAVSSTSWTMR